MSKDIFDEILDSYKSANPVYDKDENENINHVEDNTNIVDELFTKKTVNDKLDEHTLNTLEEQAAYTKNDYSFLAPDLDKLNKYGVSPGADTNVEELQKTLSDKQSNAEKIGNFVVQSVGGEMILGVLDGFVNIGKGLTHMVTDGTWKTPDETNIFYDLQERLREEFEIHRANPDKTFDVGDLGWWLNNGVSAFSTVGLMIPSTAIAKGIGAIGKGLGAANAVSRVSKAAGKLSTITSKASTFEKTRKAITRANAINRHTKEFGELALTAGLSRTAENYMEGREVYNNKVEEAFSILDGMGETEFKEWIKYKPEFLKEDGTAKSKEEIAHEIATKAANQTFSLDWAMIMQDMLEYKALGKLFGRRGDAGRRTPTARERIDARNELSKSLGVSEDKLIKNNFINRRKEAFRQIAKNPVKSITGIEFSEGFEEMYQGISSAKGEEIVDRYFDSSIGVRPVSSYLTDSEIWEQGFWGIAGAHIFQKSARIADNLYRKGDALVKKQRMTKEEYDAWKKSTESVSKIQAQQLGKNAADFVEKIQDINNNINPYETILDPLTGEELIVDGKLITNDLNEYQKDYVTQKAIDEFIINTTLESADAGTFDLMKELIGGTEFDTYLKSKGIEIGAGDKILNKQVADRMQEIYDTYINNFSRIESFGSEYNPWNVVNIARTITRAQIKANSKNKEIDDLLLELDNVIENSNDTNLTTGIQNAYNEIYRDSIRKLYKDLSDVENQYNDGNISFEAYAKTRSIIRNKIKTWNNFIEQHTSIPKETIKHILNDYNKDISEINNTLATLDAVIQNSYTTQNSDPRVQPILDKIKTAVGRKINIESNIPQSKEDITDMFDEFERFGGVIFEKNVKKYGKVVEDYLKNAEDLDKAIDDLFNGTTNKKLKEATEFFRYHYKYLANEFEDYSAYLSKVVSQTSLDNELERLINNEIQRRKKIQDVNNDLAKDGIDPDTTTNTNTQSQSTPKPTTQQTTTQPTQQSSQQSSQQQKPANNTNNTNTNAIDKALASYYDVHHDYTPKDGDIINIAVIDEKGKAKSSGKVTLAIKKDDDGSVRYGFNNANGKFVNISNLILEFKKGFRLKDKIGKKHKIITSITTINDVGNKVVIDGKIDNTKQVNKQQQTTDNNNVNNNSANDNDTNDNNNDNDKNDNDNDTSSSTGGLQQNEQTNNITDDIDKADTNITDNNNTNDNKDDNANDNDNDNTDNNNENNTEQSDENKTNEDKKDDAAKPKQMLIDETPERDTREDVSGYKEDDEIVVVSDDFFNPVDDAIASIKAQISYLGHKDIAKIIQAYEKGDITSAKKEFVKLINSIISKLKNRGEVYSEDIIKKAVNEAFLDMIDMYKNINNETPLSKLAFTLSNLLSNKKSAITSTISNKRGLINNVIPVEKFEEFLQEFVNEFASLHGGITYNNKLVISIDDLINYIINNKNLNETDGVLFYNAIFDYIEKVQDSKYMIVGYNPNKKINAEEYIIGLKEKHEQLDKLGEAIHLHPTEQILRQDNYGEAIVAVANGAKVYAVQETGVRDVEYIDKDGHLKQKKVNYNSDIAIYTDYKRTPVKIGILRNVKLSDDNNRIMPTTHKSGFKFVIDTDENDKITLNCDDFFNQLILAHNGFISKNESNVAARELLQFISDYKIKINDAKTRLEASGVKGNRHNNTTKQKELDKALDGILDKLWINPLVEKLIKEGKYRHFNNDGDTNDRHNKDNAHTFLSSIANILFGYGYNIELDVAKKYNDFKENLKANYEFTYNLEKAIEKQSKEKDANKNRVYVRLNIPTHKILNIDGERHLIKDEPFSGVQNPAQLAFIQNGKVTSFNNKVISYIENIESNLYTYAMVVGYHGDTPLYTILDQPKPIDKAHELRQAFEDEIRKLIDFQINKKTNIDDIELIINHITELIGNPKSLFASGNIRASATENHEAIEIYHYDKKNNKKTSIITFFKTNNKSADVSNAIAIGDKNNNTRIFINNKTFEHKDSYDAKQANEAIDNAINDICENIKVNISGDIFNINSDNNIDKKESFKNKKVPRYRYDENGKFIVTIGGKTFTYDNYKEFIISANTFDCDIHSDDGSFEGFIKLYASDKFYTIDGYVYDKDDNLITPNILEAFNNSINKTLTTTQVLLTAGITREQLDVIVKMLGDKILNKNIKLDTDVTRNDYMYYKYDKKTPQNSGVFITHKGAGIMNNPTTALRLVLHENIHRLLNNRADKERIIKDMEQVYDYFKTKLISDFNNGKFKDNEEVYNGIQRLIDTIEKAYAHDKQLLVEEFIAESLSQPILIDYLNNAEYKTEVSINGIKKKETLLQKLINFVLELFHVGNKVKDNTILAKEYSLLFTSKNSLNNSLFNNNANNDNNVSSNNATNTNANNNDTSNDNTSTNNTANTNNDSIRNDASASNQRSLPVEGDDTTDTPTKPIVSNNAKPKNNTTKQNDNNPINELIKQPINKGDDEAQDNNLQIKDGKVNVERLANKKQTIDNPNITRTLDVLDNVITQLSARIKRSETFEQDHKYIFVDDKGNKVEIDTSVTQFIHGKNDIGDFGTPASTLGNTADEAARNYFENGTIGKVGDVKNVTETQHKELEESMNVIEQHLDSYFNGEPYYVVTKEFTIASKVVHNGKEISLAGTMDMIVIDSKGEIHIFDFKTKRADGKANLTKEVKEGYFSQVNIYRQILNTLLDGTGIKVNTAELIKFNVSYPNPAKGKIEYESSNGQLKIKINEADAVNIEEATNINYVAPNINVINKNNLETFIPVPTKDYTTKDGLVEFKPIFDIKHKDVSDNTSQTNDNETITKQDVETDSQMDNFDDIFDYSNDDIYSAITETIVGNENIDDIISDIYHNNDDINITPVIKIASMNQFIERFSPKEQPLIRKLIENQELKYLCR